MGSDYNLFICWSDERSKAVGRALMEWLPNVIQDIKPWFSEDIEKGSLWDVELSTQLKELKLGILCLTPDNLNSAWLHFEAGALAKTLTDARVCPYLYKVSPSEVKKPLSRFQATKAEKGDTLKLVRTINKALGEKLKDSKLDSTFDKWWGDLDSKLNDIPPAEEMKPKRDSNEMIVELLETVRSMSRKITELSDYQAQVLSVKESVRESVWGAGAPGPTGPSSIPWQGTVAFTPQGTIVPGPTGTPRGPSSIPWQDVAFTPQGTIVREVSPKKVDLTKHKSKKR
jgi:hypothetical protein